MALPPEEIAQVRAATDLVALISEEVALKKAGQRWIGLCPFHGEKTPSFSVNAEMGVFYCFGCQVSGDAISWVRERQGLPFIDAVRVLADRAGITLHEDEMGTERKDRAQILDAIERAVAFYHERLLTAPDAAPARSYLRSRGYDGDVVRAFRLGWAPDDWDQLARHLQVSEKILEEAGLGFTNRRGRPQDFLRARVVFPICDTGGRPIAMGGRIMPPAEGQPPPDRPQPKYKNSPETAVYSKRRTLYALNWAKKDVVATSEIIVCEGYTDVIAFFQAGLPRAVATCGTALGEEHFRLMRNFARRIVLAYDGDEAGQKATGRVYEWERAHEVDVAVCELPEGTDPAELARSDPGALRDAVDHAKPFLQFRVDRALSMGDLSTPEGRARAAEEALGAVAEHPDVLVRDQYVMGIADRCRLDPALVRERLSAHVAGERTHEQSPSRAPRRDQPDHGDDDAPDHLDPGGDDHLAGPVDKSGLEALRLAVHRPDLVVDRLEPILFVDLDQRAAFEALTRAATVSEAIDQAPAPAAALLRRVTVEEPSLTVSPGQDPVRSVVAQMVRRSVQAALSRLLGDIRLGVIDAAQGSRDVTAVQEALSELDDPVLGVAAEQALVGWLSEEGARGDR